MIIKLRPLAHSDMAAIVRWRQGVPESLRTPYDVTYEMQERWYEQEICNRESHTRYWAVTEDDGYTMVGYGGIENIQWENRLGEISLLIDPTRRGDGLGRQSVQAFLDKAFNYMNLHMVWGECYYSGPTGFWAKMVKEIGGEAQRLRARKYWDGKYYDSLYFYWIRRNYEKPVYHTGQGREQANS